MYENESEIEKIIISVIRAYGGFPNYKLLTPEARKFLDKLDLAFFERACKILTNSRTETEWNVQFGLNSLHLFYDEIVDDIIQVTGDYKQIYTLKPTDWFVFYICKKLKVPLDYYHPIQLFASLFQHPLGYLSYHLIAKFHIFANMYGREFLKDDDRLYERLFDDQLKSYLDLNASKVPPKDAEIQLRSLIKEYIDTLLALEKSTKQDIVCGMPLDIPNEAIKDLLDFKIQQIALLFILSIFHYQSINATIPYNGTIGDESKPADFSKSKIDQSFLEEIKNNNGKLKLDACKRIALAAGRCYDILTNRVIGISKEIEELRLNTWHACFGKNLLTAYNYEDLIRRQNVLIIGEPGVGKELIADAIQTSVYWHNKEKPQVLKINVTALSENIAQSELFGHVKGAFTGADRDKEGLLKKADNCSIFLDEIGDLQPEIQVRLLRAIQFGEIQKVGSDEIEKVSLRFISATNSKDIMVNDKFRKDLFERIAHITIRVPPLRIRKKDIPLIIDNIVKKNARSFHLYFKDLYNLRNQLDEIETDWPGNVRQLESVVTNSILGLEIKNVVNRENLFNDDSVSLQDEFVNKIINYQVSEEELKKWYTDWVIAHAPNKKTAYEILGKPASTYSRRKKKRTRTNNV